MAMRSTVMITKNSRMKIPIRSPSPREPVKRRYRKSRLVGIDILPAQVSQSTHSLDPSIENDDFCSTCRGISEFLCCEACPKSFHLDYLDSLLEVDSLPEGQWFCQECQAKQAPPLS
ncbi:hypothetical protein, no similarity [Geotrichum candidum]|uniref:Zinc finger PHD-type domain-containing protein n=1 Tax=Geotrichum candidum TaxID=1173061 RepID=A0A0J9XHD4_GEOCN|nr:hypothetical protein, no similarity [Geotrichum candidum]